jgi:opacity protein-like surface antigen
VRNGVILHTALLAAALSSGLAAQTTPPLRFGVQAGLNFATWGGDDADALDPESRTGFLAGGFAEYRLSQYFSLRPEISYSQQGWEYKEQGAKFEWKQDYLQIPVLLKAAANLKGQPKLHPVGYLGPAVGFQTRCKVKVSAQGQSAEDDCEDLFGFFQLDIKKTDFGMLFGGGLEYDRVSLTVRYLLGLTSLDDSGSDADIKNRVVTVLAGFRF